MDALDKDISAFEKVRENFETHYMGKWVLFHDEKMIGAFDTFDGAAQEATQKFGKGPYLIRQVGARSQALPASVLYQQIHA